MNLYHHFKAHLQPEIHLETDILLKIPLKLGQCCIGSGES